MITTSRLGMDVPQGTDSVSAYPTVAAQAFGILDNAAIYEQGTLVSLPAASSVAAGTVYYATDTTQYFISTGSAWVTALVTTPWVTLTLQSGLTVSGVTPAVRLEGDVVRMKGAAINLTGSAISSNAALLPSGMYPGATFSHGIAFDSPSATSGTFSAAHSTGEILILNGSSQFPTFGIFDFTGITFTTS